ncbi:FIG001590: Putative conserved exported protein precursor [hydrothermal vent metagenome]|uniref:FIG001590: Putative conserved exported protein n=1 Tax=hydrothermal vent metagenome TaxID=652676 RepID=A0A1W1CRP2_9ZZZZ
MAKKLPELTEVEHAMSHLNVDDDASYAHGVLCGMVVVKGKINLDEWLNEVIVSIDFNNLLEKQSHNLLTILFERTIAQLADPVLRFELLIIDENDDLQNQLKALKSWVSGFILGLGFGKIRTKNEEVLDIIKTLSLISGSTDEIENNDENENDFYEIAEFVRMGVLFIQEELHHNQKQHVPTTIKH